VIEPVSDAAALFYAAPYLTRLYSTMSADEMTVDPAFDYNFELAQVSNIHIAKQWLLCESGSPQRDAPWRIELPQGGVVLGEGDDGWPVAAGSLPANLKVVMLSSSGSGKVVTDNSADIGMQLFETAGTTGLGNAGLRPPQHGLLIGGSQTVIQHRAASSTRSRARERGADSCGVARVGARTRCAFALGLPLAALGLARRRGRSRRA
jgi:hypothetical protein